MNYQTILITPTMAKQMLETNVKNRPVKTPGVMRYANEMQAGRWIAETGQPIKMSKTGKLLDGQHRLLAIVLADIPVLMELATGFDDNIFSVLDVGSTRSSADVFFIEDVKYNTSIPSIITNYFVYKNGKIGGKGVQKNLRCSNSQLLEIYHQDSEKWQDIATFSYWCYNQFSKVISPGLIGGLFAIFAESDPNNARLFFEQLSTGQGVTNRTIYTLRKSLMDDKSSNKRLSTVHKTALIIKSWNHFKIDKEVKLIRFNPLLESYPIAI